MKTALSAEESLSRLSLVRDVSSALATDLLLLDGQGRSVLSYRVDASIARYESLAACGC